MRLTIFFFVVALVFIAAGYPIKDYDRCEPGTQFQAYDGCNSCTCLNGIRSEASCTKIGCPVAFIIFAWAAILSLTAGFISPILSYNI